MTRTAGKSVNSSVSSGCGMWDVCDRMKERLIERWRGVAIELHKDLVGTD